MQYIDSYVSIQIAVIHTENRIPAFRNFLERFEKQIIKMSDVSSNNPPQLWWLFRKIMSLYSFVSKVVGDPTCFRGNLQKVNIFQNTKTMLSNTKRELDELRWANEALELRFELVSPTLILYSHFYYVISWMRQIQSERDDLTENFTRGILEVQQKAGLKNALLQKRVQTLTDLSEHKDVRIAELAAASEKDGTPIATKKLQVSKVARKYKLTSIFVQEFCETAKL